jgi:hypothetical protein
MDIKNILILLLPLLTALLSSYLTYYMAIRSKKTEAMIKFKEEKYSNLIIALQGFVGSTAAADTKKKFYEEQYKSWRYSSGWRPRQTTIMLQMKPKPRIRFDL